jgi:hypothetical protein
MSNTGPICKRWVALIRGWYCLKITQKTKVINPQSYVEDWFLGIL